VLYNLFTLLLLIIYIYRPTKIHVIVIIMIIDAVQVIIYHLPN